MRPGSCEHPPRGKKVNKDPWSEVAKELLNKHETIW